MDEADLSDDPLEQLAAWLDRSRTATSPRADAMTLATADANGRPSARQVLLRGLDARGLVFFTNHGSKKARELAENPRAAIVFHWYAQGRQVRVEGGRHSRGRGRVGGVLADAATRQPDRGLGITSIGSPSQAAKSSIDCTRTCGRGSRTSDVPLPPFWGGYRVVPDSIEFWQHHDDRLHDRIRYVRTGAEWQRERLAP